MGPIVVGLCGLIASFLSGLVGIGGGIVLAPMLLYLAPLATGVPLGIHQVTSLTIVQNVAAGFTGMARHRNYGYVSRDLVLWMGIPTAVTSLAGAVVSVHVSAPALEGLFSVIAMLAAVLMVLPVSQVEEAKAEGISFSRPTAVVLAGGVGFMSGMVGLAGASILIPLMIHVLRIPTRVVLGSSLGIVAFSATAGALGKLGTGQLDLALGAALVVAVLPGAQLGSWLSRRVQPRVLRYVLAGALALTAVRMWYDLLK